MSTLFLVGEVIDTKGRKHFIATNDLTTLPFRPKSDICADRYVLSEKEETWKLWLCNADNTVQCIIIARDKNECERVMTGALGASFFFMNVDATFNLAATYKKGDKTYRRKFKPKLLECFKEDANATDDFYTVNVVV